MLGIFGDVVVEFEHEAFRLKGADPFVRGDEHVRPLADTEDLEELQGVVVETLRRAFAHHHLDALVGALGLERLVQPLSPSPHCQDAAARMGPAATRARVSRSPAPAQARTRSSQQQSRHQHCSQQRQSCGLPASHGALPHSCDTVHGIVVFDCGAAQRNNAPLRPVSAAASAKPQGSSGPTITAPARGHHRSPRQRGQSLFRQPSTAPDQERTPSDHALQFPCPRGGRVHVCGHRGYSLRYPENTRWPCRRPRIGARRPSRSTSC